MVRCFYVDLCFIKLFSNLFLSAANEEYFVITLYNGLLTTFYKNQFRRHFISINIYHVQIITKIQYLKYLEIQKHPKYYYYLINHTNGINNILDVFSNINKHNTIHLIKRRF